MNAAKQACRPKHQVLVLKCYPRHNKQNVDAQANSSELSYLLYYASTRRSKLPKVAAFLDKRTAADVPKGRAQSISVTLQIVAALVDKCPRDLPLFAAAVLDILRLILAAGHVAMVCDTVPVFEALCAHQDPAQLAADLDYTRAYEAIVQRYAAFAAAPNSTTSSTSTSTTTTTAAPTTTIPVALRLRRAGLQALKAVAASDSLGAQTGRQLAALIPVLLHNLHATDADADAAARLARLEAADAAAHDDDALAHDLALRRRQSAAAGTTADADKLAEDEVAILALQALKNLFQGVNRGQLRLATAALLEFMATVSVSSAWATRLMAMVCAWAPVQDRYAILVALVEALVGSPIVDSDMDRQLLLASLVAHLLTSPINFIGLSVMDVLVGLVSHTLLLLQLGGPGSAIAPHPQQPMSPIAGSKSPDLSAPVVMDVVKEPSHARVQLLQTVQQCMAGLATHVYYTDQISDMIDAILTRLKPSRLSSVSSTADAIENPEEAIDAVAASGSLREKAHVDRFFSFETARVTALEAVKAIIITANKRRPDGSVASVARSKVAVRVWEGTQWLLRDPSGQVRKAYVDALDTWLNLEAKDADQRLVDGYKTKDNEQRGGMAKRAVSSASYRDKSPKRGKHTFLPLLHLAIYENALQYADSEADLLLLHLLLTTLVTRLGVNTARSGLPMILRLQEDVATVEDPSSKLRIGSLVHGYLWALSTSLDFETSSIGRIIHNEISRRSSHGLWLKSIRVPPVPISSIDTPHSTPTQLPAAVVQSESLIPFDHREALVECISEGYSTSLSSPPSSPPASPGRARSMSTCLPSIQQPLGSGLRAAPQLPFSVREDLLADWTRDQCLAANTKSTSPASMSGSRSGTHYASTQKNNYLGVRIPNGDFDSAGNSPVPSPRRAHSRPPSAAYGLVGRLSSPHRNSSPSGTPRSTSSLQTTVRVDDLKRALSQSGGAPRTSYSMRPVSHRRRGSEPSSSASESMVSVHSLSDSSFITTDQPFVPPSTIPESPGTPAASLTPRPQEGPSTNGQYFVDAIPPVPPIPVGLRDRSASVATTGDKSEKRDFALNKTTNGSLHKSRSVKSGVSRGRSGERYYRGSEVAQAAKPDFSGFLDSIGVDDADDDEGDDEVHGMGRAPY